MNSAILMTIVMVTLFIIISTTIFLTEINDQENLPYKYLNIPLKFAVREVKYPESDYVEYSLYYKRFLFWHPYVIHPAMYCDVIYTGSYDEVLRKIRSIRENRDYWRKYNSANRWWKNKLKKI